MKEPFHNLLTQGMVLNDIYSRRTGDGARRVFQSRRCRRAVRCEGCALGATLRADGQPVDWEGMRTMSKSKNNGVDPTELVARYGADSVRLFMMFKAPPEDTLEWSDDGVEGAARFLRRLWRMVREHLREGPVSAAVGQDTLTAAQRDMRRAAHATLVKVTRRSRPPPRVQHGDRCGDGADERAGEVRRCHARRAAPCGRRRWS